MRNTIEIIIKYLKTTHPLRMMWHLLWLFCVLCILSMSYIVTFHFTPVLDLWQRSRSMYHFRTELATTIEVDTQVHHELQRLLDQTGGHRTYLFRYHNGIASVNGVPFMFHTNTHEVIKHGVSRVIGFNQRLPSGIAIGMNLEFARRKCVVMVDIDRNTDGSNYWYFQTRGAYAMIRCAVYSSQGDLLGFVGIDFTERTASNVVRSKEADVQAAAQNLSTILERR